MPPSSAQPIMDPQWAAESNLVRILAVTGVFHFLALSSVGLRLYARIGLLRSPGRDDVVMILAVLAALSGYICFILQGYHGLGRHTETESKEDKVIFHHIGFYQSLLSAIGALGLLKISIAFFLLRLRNNNLWKWYARTLWALIGFIVVYTIGAWLSFLLHCAPVEADWTGEGTCYSREIFVPVALTNTAVNIFTDICFATIPIPIIWSLQMSRATRINLIGVLSLGYIAVALGIVKASYQVKTDPDKMFNKHLNVFGFLQLNVGIIAASIPTLKPLTKKRTAAPRRRPYDNIEQRIGTIGSGRNYRPHPSFLTKVMVTDETIGMGKRQSLREKLSMTGTDRKDTVYSQAGDRGGSQDRILESGGEDRKRIKCTTEVMVDSVEHDAKT